MFQLSLLSAIASMPFPKLACNKQCSKLHKPTTCCMQIKQLRLELLVSDVVLLSGGKASTLAYIVEHQDHHANEI